MLFGLIVVIFLIYLTAFFYQKLISLGTKLNKKNLNLPDVNKIKIESSTPLGQGRNLHIIQVNGKTLLLGETANQINLVCEFDKNEVKDYRNYINKEEDCDT